MTTTDVYFHPIFLQHDTGSHPECAERLVAARQRLLRSDLNIEWVEPRAADVQMVTRVHAPAYVDSVRRLAEAGGGRLDLDSVVSAASYEAALHAAGAGVQAVERAVLDARRSFLLVRPPGHHARHDQGMGFCIFNNIAVAATHALEVLGLQRVLIVDWDVHHGNGTQEAFYEDPRVLYFSLHLGNHYPGTGSLEEIGAGAGIAHTVNLPLRYGAGEGVVSAFFSRVIRPLAHAFEPQLVLVSAGYDSADGDPLGGLLLSSGFFRWMSGSLSDISARSGAAGPVFFLEGGYDMELLAAGIEATIEGLNAGAGYMGGEPTAPETALIDVLVRRLSPYWVSALA